MGCLLIYFLHPELEAFEGVPISYVIDHNDAVGSLVVSAGDGAESILAGCVPLHQ